MFLKEHVHIKLAANKYSRRSDHVPWPACPSVCRVAARRAGRERLALTPRAAHPLLPSRPSGLSVPPGTRTHPAARGALRAGLVPFLLHPPPSSTRVRCPPSSQRLLGRDPTRDSSAGRSPQRTGGQSGDRKESHRSFRGKGPAADQWCSRPGPKQGDGPSVLP